MFDYRRYDAGTVAFGREAARRGADVVLFTDPYLSPLSAAATVLLDELGRRAAAVRVVDGRNRAGRRR